jgi:hypothetical protein
MIALPRRGPSLLDVLRLFLIDVGQRVAGRLVGMKQLVKLGMDGLRQLRTARASLWLIGSQP